MDISIDKYLSTLLSFAPCDKGDGRKAGDYISLIHIPVEGPEEVYSLSFDSSNPTLVVARFQETVWDYLAKSRSGSCQLAPQVDVLQAITEYEHPIFDYVNPSLLADCMSHSDGRPGMDYYLLMWQFDGYSSVSECWEPYRRGASSWITLIGAMQALSSQYEYTVREKEPVTA